MSEADRGLSYYTHKLEYNARGSAPLLGSRLAPGLCRVGPSAVGKPNPQTPLGNANPARAPAWPRPTSRNRINLNACGIVAPAPAARGRPAEQGHRASRRPCARVCCRVPCWKSAPQKTEELLTSTFSRPPVCTLSVHFIQSSSSSQYTLLRRSSATLCTVRHFPKGKQFNACKECNYQKQIHFCDRRDGGTHCLLRRATALRPDDPNI